MREKIQTSVKNDIKIVTDHIPGSRSISLGFWLEYGTRDEPEGKTGLAHFLEHMLFKGTSRYSAYDIVQRIESLGGILNAFTTKELICIHVEILDEMFDSVFDLLCQMILDSRLSDADIEKEKEVVFEEISGVEDIPEEYIEDRFSEYLFSGSTLARPILGFKETVANFTRSDLLHVLQEILSSRGMAITAAGNIDHHHLEKHIARQMDFTRNVSPQDYHIQAVLPSKPVQMNKAYVQSHMMVGMPVCGYSHPDRYLVVLLNYLLGAQMSSTLFQVLREEKGLAYHLYSFYEFYRETGMFNIYVGTDRRKREEAHSVIQDELAGIRSSGISPGKLEELKSRVQGQMVLKLEKIPNRMLNLGRQIVYNGGAETLEDVLKRINAVTPEEMDRFLRSRILPEKILTIFM